ASFVCGHGGPRDPHSFPTRRSSDLAGGLRKCLDFVGDDGIAPPGEQLMRALRVVDGPDRERQSFCTHRFDQGLVNILVIEIKPTATQAPDPFPPVLWQFLLDEQGTGSSGAASAAAARATSENEDSRGGRVEPCHNSRASRAIRAPV